MEVLSITAAPTNEVIAIIRTRGWARQSGIEVDMEFSFVFTIRDARISEWGLFVDEGEALEAAGPQA